MVRTANTLPRNWPRSVKSAMMHVISLAQYATMYTRSWAANSVNPRLRRKADLDERDQEIARLREHVRILLARIGRIPAHQRPQYLPTDRLAILQLKAA
jgi:hypothetical protein